MTGYGRGGACRDGRSVSVEMRSVNHRFLDLSLRLPRAFSFAENDLRAQVGEALRRGHVDITLTYRNGRSDAKDVSVDEVLCRGALAALRAAGEKLGVKDNVKLSDFLSLPDALVVQECAEDEDALRLLSFEAAESALSALVAMREREGESLLDDLRRTLDRAEEKVNRIAQKAAGMPDQCFQRVAERLKQLRIEGADTGRILQEAAMLSDRCAVDEELARLRAHIGQMRLAFALPSEQGRRMDFLVQEMNREANTIASKSQDGDVTHLAVDLKCDIEKMREQIQNVE